MIVVLQSRKQDTLDVIRKIIPHYPKCAEVPLYLLQRHARAYGYDLDLAGFLEGWISEPEIEERRSGRTLRGLLTADLFHSLGFRVCYIAGKGMDYTLGELRSRKLRLPHSEIRSSDRDLRGLNYDLFVVDSTALKGSEYWEDLASATASFYQFHLHNRSEVVKITKMDRIRLQWDMLKGLASSSDRDHAVIPLSVITAQMVKKWQQWRELEEA